ncbi:MAG: vWA domain-containing protein [Aureliella sp.]
MMRHKQPTQLAATLCFGVFGLVLVGCGRQVASDANMRANALATDGAPLGMRQNGIETGVALNTEAYDSVKENPFHSALEQPQSTFSVDVDTASYANVRRLLTDGQRPPAGAVRIEELINYFDYEYPQPNGPHPFSVTTELATCPWQPKHQLLRVGLQGQAVDFTNRAPCNLVFLLDVSGSMHSARKLPLVQSAMKMLTEELRPNDRIAIAVYAGASGLVLPSTPVSRSAEILQAIDQLQAGGATNGAAGIQLAYQTAEENFVSEGINRVILCTDGDFNVGTTSQSELVDLVQQKAKSNVFLTVLGFGSGNLKDSTMEKLADKGNGNYGYIDSMLEARKVLVEEIGGTLMTIAKDVKIQLDFNPMHVQAYRLIGYENRVMENQDFRDDSKDAGEIGAGHSVTALYEIVPAGADGVGDGERKSEFVNKQVSSSADHATQLTVNVRYKRPDEEAVQEFQVRVAGSRDLREPSLDFQFVSAVAGYGMLLRGSEFAGAASWDWVIETADASLGSDERGVRAEFLRLAKTARRVSM